MSDSQHQDCQAPETHNHRIQDGLTAGQTELLLCRTKNVLLGTNLDRPGGALHPILTLHVHHQQCVADSQWRPEPEGLCGREELLIDDPHGGQHGHGEGNDNSSAQHGQQAAAPCEQADADAAVALWAVEFIQSRDMVQQAWGLAGQEPAESCSQEQTEPALRRPLVQEVEAAAEGAAQGELALD